MSCRIRTPSRAISDKQDKQAEQIGKLTAEYLEMLKLLNGQKEEKKSGGPTKKVMERNWNPNSVFQDQRYTPMWSARVTARPHYGTFKNIMFLYEKVEKESQNPKNGKET